MSMGNRRYRRCKVGRTWGGGPQSMVQSGTEAKHTTETHGHRDTRRNANRELLTLKGPYLAGVAVSERFYTVG